MRKFYEWLKESPTRAGAVGAPAALLGEFAVLYASYLRHQERHP